MLPVELTSRIRSDDWVNNLKSQLSVEICPDVLPDSLNLRRGVSVESISSITTSASVPLTTKVLSGVAVPIPILGPSLVVPCIVKPLHMFPPVDLTEKPISVLYVLQLVQTSIWPTSLSTDEKSVLKLILFKAVFVVGSLPSLWITKVLMPLRQATCSGADGISIPIPTLSAK